ncbi:hypothetical protein NDU88_006853 [Pleurodeles waltl]|uniref:Uncharacterized protein n=1 Tax=Pleurodeles waltl TaxID=8319 RepID=A0AAV7N0E8_PLEWA|nr:hypothetical protein NDU88_006853 [Pleurodeles waltl]
MPLDSRESSRTKRSWSAARSEAHQQKQRGPGAQGPLACRVSSRTKPSRSATRFAGHMKKQRGARDHSRKRVDRSPGARPPEPQLLRAAAPSSSLCVRSPGNTRHSARKLSHVKHQ